MDYQSLNWYASLVFNNTSGVQILFCSAKVISVATDLWIWWYKTDGNIQDPSYIDIYWKKKEEFVPFYGYIQSSWKGKKCYVTNSDENVEGVFASKCSDSIGRCFGFCCRQAVCGDSSTISIACSSIVYNLCNWLVRGKALPRVEGTHTNTKLAYKGDQSDGTMSTLNLEWLCHFFFSSSSLKTY